MGQPFRDLAERLEAIQEWKTKLSMEVLASADLQRGRRLFQKSCAQCHRLFGEGEAIGPELTGAQRNNLDYLLETSSTLAASLAKIIE